jgi:hypothetical protein
MNILFNDLIQNSDAPKELKSSSLADRYEYENEIPINFDKPYRFNSIGIGNTDAETITIKMQYEGINWTPTTLPSSANWYSVAYGNGKFVAIAYYSNKAAYSTDGINWTETTMPSSGNWWGFTYGNGKFVAIATSNSNKAAYSLDGITWIAATMPSIANWHSVAYGNGKFVTASYGSTKAAYSTDGINWTETTMPSSANWYSVAYGNDMFVSIADNGNQAAFSNDIYSHTLNISGNGLYLFPESETRLVKIKCDGSYIGRIAMGNAVNLKTSIPKEPTLVSTNKPRVTLSGQVIDGLGGYDYWRVSLDTRYKIDKEKMEEIIKGFPSLSRGLPLFVSFEDEGERLPFTRLYCNDTNQQQLSFESSINKSLFSRRFIFEERF